ncbi:MAG: Polysaccharide deacetylase family protein [Parcubacteria group bacterium GW2011_GWA2_36_10]|nr:MAG: Polysaccharide deacetylase family protein [Parcubacteria group bacterium GW2011_GWA2_36_10]
MKDYFIYFICYLLNLFFPVKNKKFLPVFLFHSISQKDASLSLGLEDFESKIKYLKLNGYHSITSLDIINGQWPEKSFILTFDDGYQDNYTNALPILKKYGFVATVFIATDYIGRDNNFAQKVANKNLAMLNETEILALKQEGWCIANHLAHHKDVDTLSPEEIREEYQKALISLQNIIGPNDSLKIVAYPHNKYNDLAKKALSKEGVLLAFAGGRTLYSTQDKMSIPRIEILRDLSLMKFKTYLNPFFYKLREISKNMLKFKINKNWLLAISSLILVRLLILFLAKNNFPYLGENNSFLFFGFSGDELDYFKGAQSLLSWHFVENLFPIGFSLLLAPLVCLWHAKDIMDIILPVAIINNIFFVVSVCLVYILAKDFLHNKKKALGIASLFVIYPYFFYYLFHFFAQDSVVINNFKISRFGQLMYFYAISDPFSTILMLSALLLFLKFYKNTKISFAFMLGILVGLATLTRLQNFIIIPVYLGIFSYFKQYKNISYFILGGLPFAVLQAYINFMSYGSSIGSVYDTVDYGGPVFGLRYLFKIIEYPLHYGPILLIPLLLFLFLLASGIITVTKNNKEKGWILLLYFGVILGFISLLAPTFLNPRYFLPIIPIMFLYIYSALEKIILYFKQYVKR